MTNASSYRITAVVQRTARRKSACALVLLAFLSAGCGGNGVQSALRPGGPGASEIAGLWWILFWMGSVVFVLVIILMLMAVFARSSDDGPPLGDSRFLVATGIVGPFIILFAVLFFSVRSTLTLRTPNTALTIEVIGHQFWWEVRYPDGEITIANELYIPAGRPVHLQLTADDVIHSFWVPSLHGKMDLIPGKVNNFWIAADSVGRFRGQCAEYCGAQHANMALWVHALEPDAFERWIDRRRAPPGSDDDDLQERGFEIFTQSGCDACHAIAGTPAEGRAGPALTNIGSRLTLGAGTIRNTRSGLAAFITRSQEIKPGNEMPDQHLEPDDLEALLDYLESLQ